MSTRSSSESPRKTFREFPVCLYVLTVPSLAVGAISTSAALFPRTRYQWVRCQWYQNLGVSIFGIKLCFSAKWSSSKRESSALPEQPLCSCHNGTLQKPDIFRHMKPVSYKLLKSNQLQLLLVRNSYLKRIWPLLEKVMFTFPITSDFENSRYIYWFEKGPFVLSITGLKSWTMNYL